MDVIQKTLGNILGGQQHKHKVGGKIIYHRPVKYKPASYYKQVNIAIKYGSGEKLNKHESGVLGSMTRRGNLKRSGGKVPYSVEIFDNELRRKRWRPVPLFPTTITDVDAYRASGGRAGYEHDDIYSTDDIKVAENKKLNMLKQGWKARIIKK